MRILGGLIIGLILSLVAAPTFAAPAPFAEEIRLFGVEDEIHPPIGCETLFVGSSSFRFWSRLQQDFPKRNILKRGFGGASISDINLHFDNVVGRYRPREIIFYAGENDISSGKPVDAVLADFNQFMDRKITVLGKVPVYFISIKPSVARKTDFVAQKQLNGRVARLAAERDDLVFVDIVQPMLGTNGQPRPELFISDGLHMNRQGYSIWTKQLGLALSQRNSGKAEYCLRTSPKPSACGPLCN